MLTILRERLSQIDSRNLPNDIILQLMIDMDKSHCPLCNSKLKPTLKEQVQGELEKNTFLYYDQFLEVRQLWPSLLARSTLETDNKTLNKAQDKLKKLKEKKAFKLAISMEYLEMFHQAKFF